MAALDYRRLLFGATVAAALLAYAVFHPQTIDVHAQDSMSAPADETQLSEAGVMAVDKHWSIAELTGNSDYLNNMLLPNTAL